MTKSALLIDPAATHERALRTILGFEVASYNTERAAAFEGLGSFELVVGSPAIWVEDDERSREEDFVEAVEVLQPELFLLETVRGLASPRHWDFLQDLRWDLEDLRYEVDCKVITVGGQRRLVIVGRQDKQPVTWERGSDHRSDGAVVLANLIAANLR